MDITDTFRSDDISKSDLFDFVVSNEDNGPLPHFNRSLKSFGIYLENVDNNNSSCTNNNIVSCTTSTSTCTTNTTTTTTSCSTSTNTTSTVVHNSISNDSNEKVRNVEEEKVEDRKVERNNNMITNGSYVDNSYWNSAGLKEDRWEMLEELNCWNQEGNNEKLCSSGNTDGAIYTLTVLNGNDQQTWYRLPEVPQDSEEVQQPQNSHRVQGQAQQSTASLDFDTLLSNIIPNPIPSSLQQSTFFCPVSQDPSRPQVSEGKGSSSPIKPEFLYDDFQEKRRFESGNPLENNNNNDWKSSESASSDTRVNSLLRNALQGKSQGFARYNGVHSPLGKPEKPQEISVPSCKDSTAFQEVDDSIKTQSPLMAVSLEGGTVVMFDGGSGSGSMLVDSDNPSSAQSMDDIFLSHLDSVSYAEDYEKLKSIENEVAKSVEQYCNPYMTSSPHLDTSRIPSISHLDNSSMNLNSIPSTTSSKGKKYTKRSSQSSKNHHLQTAGSSGGIRKERSLHYCTICHKGFKDKYSVNVHVRTHTGEKPFTCTFCGKNFRQKAHLAKHHHTHSVQKNAAASGMAAGTSAKPHSSKHR